jgi:hypothetical protein
MKLFEEFLDQIGSTGWITRVLCVHTEIVTTIPVAEAKVAGLRQEPRFSRLPDVLISEMALPEGLGAEIAVAAKVERWFRKTNLS